MYVKKSGKFVSLFLSLCIVFSCLPVLSVSASASNPALWENFDKYTFSSAQEFTSYLRSLEGIQAYTPNEAKSNLCQSFVWLMANRCFDAPGYGDKDANAARRRFLVSKDWDIPLGAAVYFSGGTHGHVGFYVGDNEIVHVRSKKVDGKKTYNWVYCDPISKITDEWGGYKYQGWGWQGYYEIPSCDHVSSTLDFEKYGYCTNCASVDDNKVTRRDNGKSYQLTLNIMSRTGPYSAAANAQQMYAGETFVALGEYENLIYNDNANHVWLRFEKNGQTCFVNSNSVVEIKPLSTLSVSDTAMPSGHYDQLKKFGLRGIFSSNYNITRVLAYVYDANNNPILHYDAAPNRKSYNIKTDGLNDSFAFKTLSNGSYTYSVTAYDASGAKKAISSSFSIGAAHSSTPAPTPAPTPVPTLAPTPTPVPTYLPVYEAPVLTPVPTQTPVITPAPTQTPVHHTPEASTLSVTGTDHPSGYYASLSNYGLRGIFSSNCDITRILAYVYDAYGNAVLCYDTAPYRKNYNIQYDGLNNAFSFGSLPSGSYTYSVAAYDAFGAECSYSSNFEIGGKAAPASSPSDIPINEINKYMTVNVGAGSTLRFCSYVSVADQYEVASISNGASVYVYGITTYQYENRTWAKINYNGTDGWVNYKWLA